MTLVDPKNLAFFFQTVSKCNFLHGLCPPAPAMWRPSEEEWSVQRQERWMSYKSARDLLHSVHTAEACLGLRTKLFTQKLLVERILASLSASEGGNFSGFLLLTGGRKSAKGDGVVPGSFGFLHQRCPLKSADLGIFLCLYGFGF
jgi:hypothetical protein